MARVLYWNVNNFSLNKIQANGAPGAAAAATDRFRYMVQSVMRGPTPGVIPDIIVIVEVFNRVREVGAEGTVLRPNGNAGLGVLELLRELRADAILGVGAGSDWCVVPPLLVGEFGQCEAVAVFYNAATLQFTGPNLFYTLYPPPGAIVGQSQPVNAATYGAIANYPPAWVGALPVARNRTTNFTIGPNQVPIPEIQLAGEWQYYAAARPVPSPPPPVYPPGRIQFPHRGCRGPFHTRFLDLHNRTINLFAVHTSPSSARQAVISMGTVPQMTAVANGEINVVLGDFNVDTFGNHWGAYNWMLVNNGMFPPGIYTCALDPRGPNGVVVANRQPYCMTHLLPTAYATPYNNVGVATDAQHNVYPRFGYMGGAWPALHSHGAIDNVFTAYGGNTPGGPAANITVVNTMTGTPYNFANPTPAGVTPELTGGLPFPSHLANNLLIQSPPANGNVGGIDSGIPANALQYELDFQSWQAFGGPRSVSDHLPLMIDV